MANADALLLSVSADIRQLQKQMDKAQGIVRDSSRRMVRTVDAANENISQKLGRGFGTAIGNNVRNLSNQVGVASDAFSGFGAAGIAASAGIAAGLIAVTVAAKQAQAALELGDMIADEAEKVGIGTDALQEYQYAIAQTGGEAKDAAPAIAAFTRTLGAAQSGLSPKAMKAFTALGFTKEQLKSFDSAEDALRAVSDKVAALGSEAERAAVAEKLGLTPLLPLLRQGTGEMDRLRKAAHDLGYVLDEDLVKSLGDLKDKSDAASQVLKVQLAAAFAGVAGSIVQAKLALADFLIEYNKLVNSANGKRILGAVGTALTTALPGGTTIRALSQLGNKGPAKVTMAELQAAMKPKAAEKPDGTSLELPPTGGGGSKKDSAAQDAAARAARQARVEEDIYRASLAEFDIYNGERRSIEERAQFALDRLDIEEKHRASELTALEKQYEITKGKEGISKAERERLDLSEAAVFAGKRQNISDDKALDLADNRLRNEQDLNRLATDLLSIAEGMAVTQAERTRIQLQILKAEREIARKTLAQSLDRNANLTPEQRAKQLGAFDAGTKALEGNTKLQGLGQTPGGSAGLAAFQDPTEGSPLSDKFAADAKAAIDASVALRQQATDDEAERTRIAQEGADARARIDEVAYESRMQFASDFFGNLASLSGSSNKTLAAIGKAAAITQATIDGVLAVQKALATYPPPFNYVAAAGVGVAAAVNVAKIAGLKDGGEVTGMGGPRDDSELRRLSVGEFVVNARDAQRNKALLMSINAGRVPNLTPAPFTAGGSQTNNTSNTFAPTLNVNVSGAAAANPGRTGRQIAAETMRSFDRAQRRGFVNG